MLSKGALKDTMVQFLHMDKQALVRLLLLQAELKDTQIGASFQGRSAIFLDKFLKILLTSTALTLVIWKFIMVMALIS